MWQLTSYTFEACGRNVEDNDAGRAPNVANREGRFWQILLQKSLAWLRERVIPLL